VLRPDDSVPWRRFSENWEEETGKSPVVVPVNAGDPLKPREIVVGVRLGNQAKAYPLARLQQQSPVQDEVAGIPIVLVVLAGKKLAKVFVLKDYRFDWKAYNPGTRVYRLCSTPS
jgi:hypothetical protein